VGAVDVTTVVVVVLLGATCTTGVGATVVTVVALWIAGAPIVVAVGASGRSETVSCTVPPVYASAENTNSRVLEVAVAEEMMFVPCICLRRIPPGPDPVLSKT